LKLFHRLGTFLKMKPVELEIPGSYVFTIPIHQDSRGSFENLFQLDYPGTINDSFRVQQVNISRNIRKGTLRGLHFQSSPYAESKIVSCLLGEAFDVMVDLRPDSKSFGFWQSVHLKPSMNSVLVPPGVAHGFQTLKDHSVLQYLHSGKYINSHKSGIRFDDPDLDILWPLEITAISDQDLTLPNFKEMGGSV